MNFRNLFHYSLGLDIDGVMITVEAEPKLLNYRECHEEMPPICGIPTYYYEDVFTLPEEVEGTIYLVPKSVAASSFHRNDVYYPVSHINKDNDGPMFICDHIVRWKP